MTQGIARELVLHVDLTPSKTPRLAIQGRLWKTFLGTDFRNALGRPEIDHITMGRGGESHIEYEQREISILVYDDGELTVSDNAFSLARCTEIERAIAAVFQVVNRTNKKRINYDVNMRLHMEIADASVKRFVEENVRFPSTPKLQAALGHYRGLRSVFLGLSKEMDIVIFYPAHVDFLYHGTIPSDPNQKRFVTAFVASSMKYLESMRRYAK